MSHLFLRGNYVPRHWFESGPQGTEGAESPTGPTGPSGETGSTEQFPESLSENQRQAWDRLVTQRDSARREMSDLKTRFQTVEGELQKIKDKEQEAADEAARKAGDYEKLSDKYKQELSTAKGEIVVLQEKLSTLHEAVEQGVETRWKELPPNLRAVWTGADDDVVGKWNWLHSKGVQDLVADLTGERTEPNRGSRPNPKPSGDRNNVEQERAALLERTSLRM